MAASGLGCVRFARAHLPLSTLGGACGSPARLKHSAADELQRATDLLTCPWCLQRAARETQPPANRDRQSPTVMALSSNTGKNSVWPAHPILG